MSHEEFVLFRDFINEHCGIALGSDKAYLFETRLTSLMALHGCEDFGSFYRLAKDSTDGKLIELIIDAMTTNETSWLRDVHPFTILGEVMLPALAEELRKGERRKIRIWSGASSTGQEAYSIAMTIHEFCRTCPDVTPDQFEIIGTDISKTAIFLAQSGRYDAIAMKRGLPEGLRERYFQEEGQVWTACDSLKRMTDFRKFNLQSPAWSLGAFDIVFMRYVAIYFSEDFKRALFDRVHEVLRPSAFLVIGAVESLAGITDLFERRDYATGSYYVPASNGGDRQ